jgi:hypothetical protein
MNDRAGVEAGMEAARMEPTGVKAARMEPARVEAATMKATTVEASAVKAAAATMNEYQMSAVRWRYRGDGACRPGRHSCRYHGSTGQNRKNSHDNLLSRDDVGDGRGRTMTLQCVSDLP